MKIEIGEVERYEDTVRCPSCFNLSAEHQGSGHYKCSKCGNTFNY